MKKDNKTIEAPIEILLVVVPRDTGDAVEEVLQKYNIKSCVRCMGEGTAQTNTADFFGFGITEREVVFAIIDINVRTQLLDEISNTMMFEERHKGLVLTLPMNSVTSAMLKNYNIKY